MPITPYLNDEDCRIGDVISPLRTGVILVAVMLPP